MTSSTPSSSSEDWRQDGRGQLQRMKKNFPPPPFPGPGGGNERSAKMQTIYYQQGYPLVSFFSASSCIRRTLWNQRVFNQPHSFADIFWVFLSAEYDRGLLSLKQLKTPEGRREQLMVCIARVILSALIQYLVCSTFAECHETYVFINNKGNSNKIGHVKSQFRGLVQLAW